MESKTGLLIWCILTTVLVMTDGCNVNRRINYTKPIMENTLNQFLSANRNNNGPWTEPISELDLKNLTTEEKRHRAQCGLHYMQEAVKLIRQHQSELNHTWNPIPGTIHVELKRTNACVVRAIGPCTNGTEKPVFSPTKTYERKQWGVAVLKISVVFLDELENFINHTT
ncbi:hypothetical protein R3I93_002702 [Phoxinus phoxinus]|uniref:Uncharacterized protein n=1 Tax=Phoxinus phoxinus TaxID=58324 RepID=A0AAN9DK00_9TELE